MAVTWGGGTERWGWRGALARLVVVGWGVGSLALSLYHGLATGHGVREIVYGYSLPIAFSLSILAIAGWALDGNVSEQGLWRLARWAVGTMVGMTGFELSRLLYQNVEGVGVAEPQFALLHAATAGVLGGLLLGIYDHRAHERQRELEAEREWSDRLSQGLLVLHRVLRHDIRTAVNVIRGNAQLVRDREAVGDTELARIVERADRLGEMATKAKHFEVVAERTDDDLRSVDLGASVRETAADLQTGAQSAVVTVDGPSSVRVLAYPEIAFAVGELLENAVVHSTNGEPSVSVSLRDGDPVELVVTDDGPGIPAEEAAVIADGEESQLLHSSGIGLWMVKWIVEGSDGDIDFDRGEDGGTVVTLTLPAASEP